MNETGREWAFEFGKSATGAWPAEIFMIAKQSRRALLKQVGGTVAWLAVPRLSFAAEQRDVPWLAEVQQPPKNPRLAETGYLEPLLVANDKKPVSTLAEWQRRREAIRRRWLEFLGGMPEPPPVKLTTLSEDRPEGCHRQLVRYESEPGLPVEGYLLRPEPLGQGRRAALVVLHQTSSNNIDEVAGVKGPEVQALGLKLARQGFIVFCPRCYLWQGVRNYDEAVLPVYRLYGEPARVGLYNHRQGHTIPAKAFERMSEWLRTYLMRTD